LQKDNKKIYSSKNNIIYTIVNPISSNNKTGKRWPAHQKQLKRAGLQLKVEHTHYPGHAITLSEEALSKGYKTIMAVGGDGTVNEVVNGFFQEGNFAEKRSSLLIFSQGTGSDYIRSLGLSKNVKDVIEIYKRQKIKWVDLGRMDYLNFDKKKTKRFFVNTADVGIGGETVEYVNRVSKLMGGLLTYLIGAVRTLFKYKNKDMEIYIDGSLIRNDQTNSVVVSLGKYFAGGMPIAPKAEIDDGLFDIIILGDLSKTETLLNMYKAYRGTHINYPKIDYIKGKTVKITSSDRVLIDIDGESAGMLPVKFQILKEAFPILS